MLRIAPNFPIKDIFNIKLITAPHITDIENSLCLFVGSKYCVPVTLLIPIINIIGLITFIKITTLSYPCPKNNGTKTFETAIIPNIMGKLSKNTTLNDFFMYTDTLSFSPFTKLLDILGSITVPSEVIIASSIFIIF